MGSRAPQPTALEAAVETVFGLEPEQIPLELGAGLDPLEALQQVVRPALERPPCVVSFSGGRDSSCVLAAATRAARREGLELPIPVSLRFPDAPRAEESSWQELVVGHLGLDEWERLTVEDGDVIGSSSTEVLRRHGLLYPANWFLTASVLKPATRGGSLLTGLGGDQLFGGWRWRSLADPLAGRRRPEPYDLLRFAYVSLPSSLRVARERRRVAPYMPDWLRPSVHDEVLALVGQRAASEPAWWRNRVRWGARRRDLSASRATIEVLADDAGALAVAPLIDPVFVAALARAGGQLGHGDRTATMLASFGGALPDRLLRRTSKATGEEVFWAGNSRRFAKRWDGSGVDPEIVDPEALRRQWLAPEPDGRSALLLQAAWLHSLHRDDPAAHADAALPGPESTRP